MMQRREILTATLGTALLSAVGLAQAQSTKTVRIVVPFAAGGVQDTLARALSQEMAAALGQTVIVENRAGAGGTVGTGYVARAEADGTVMVAAAASHNIAGSLYTKLAYDPQKDFAPLAHIGSARKAGSSSQWNQAGRLNTAHTVTHATTSMPSVCHGAST
eukprot:gene23671-26787_t